MTIQQVIGKVDELRPNQFTNAQKVEWLERADRMIWDEVIQTHDKPEDMRESFTSYSEEDMAQELLAGDTWGILYEWWLYAQMDLGNMEMAKYANDYTMFNSFYTSFANAWNRDHRPVQRARSLYFGQ